MFPPFPEEEAYSYCLRIIQSLQSGSSSLVQVTALSEERSGQGVMIGALVCSPEKTSAQDVLCGESKKILLVTCSGISRRLELSASLFADCDVIVCEPIVSAKDIALALSENDAEIHSLTDRIKNVGSILSSGANLISGDISTTDSIDDLVKRRTVLTTQSLERVHELYSFHCADGKLHSLKEICSEQNVNGYPPTGIGDCCAPKLLDYAFARSLTPLSMCEVYYSPKSLPLALSSIGKENIVFANCNRSVEESAVSANCNSSGKENASSANCNPRDEEKKLPAKCPPCDERCGILLPSMLGLRIVYRDEHIVVVNKQSGVLSVPGRGPEKQDCIVNRVRRLFPFCIEQPSVHRLDMETSGLMVLAFTAEAQRNLRIQFEKSEISKKYIALLDGVLAKKKISSHGMMELFFRLDVENRPHQIWDSVNGKSSVTEWNILNVENYFSPEGTKRPVTRIEFIPHTGRTHQLRLASSDSHGFGVPIIGDTLYGTCLPGERLCLHASYLKFKHPATGDQMEFFSDAEF